MKFTLIILCTLFVLCTGAPIVKKVKVEETEKKEAPKEDWQGKLNYDHYLTQVMDELEKDEEFGKRLRELKKNDSLKADDLATQLTFAKHSVRTRLDELKRMELKRLTVLEKRLDLLKAKRGDKDVPEEIMRMVDKQHLDHENPSTFEIDDLRRLIQQAVKDLNVIDEKQKEEFKKHEMAKEVEHKRRLKHIKDPKLRAEEEKKWNESQARHNQHEKIHAPGSENQLKDVWEKEDHMESTFNPKTFFQMHDINGDGELDEQEIDTLFQKELDKAYNPNDPDDDMQERYESMMEMRKDIMKKIDTNNDLRISFQELTKWTESPDFKKDEGFKLPEEDKSKIFNDDDLKKFEQDYDREHPDDEDDEEDEPHHETSPPVNLEVQKKDPARKLKDKVPDHL